jgi:uncharacterized protein (TIGR00251 family)
VSNSPDGIPWSYDGENLLLRIFVQPRAAKNELIGIHEGELKLRTTSPPVDGAANDACRQFFSKLLKVPKSAITIISGETSRHKRLKVAGGSAAGIELLLADRS